MKNEASNSSSGPASAFQFRRRRGRVFALRMIAAACCGGWLAPIIRAQESQLEVDVRPKVTDKSVMWSNKPKVPGEGGHGKVYGIAKVEEKASDNSGKLMVALQLKIQGFKG